MEEALAWGLGSALCLLAPGGGCVMLGVLLPSLGLRGPICFSTILCKALGPPAGPWGPHLGESSCPHPCLWAGGCGPWVVQSWMPDSRSASPKGRSEDDSYDDEMLSAIEGLSSTR